MHSSAVISECDRYRYTLTRVLESNSSRDRFCTFIMLNPSTADCSQDDPTIRRCRKFSMRFGYSLLAVINLFAFRTTSPQDLIDGSQTNGLNTIIGDENEYYQREILKLTDLVICAWGNYPNHKALDSSGQLRASIKRLIEEYKLFPMALKLTIGGNPMHPLYVQSSSDSIFFE